MHTSLSHTSARHRVAQWCECGLVAASPRPQSGQQMGLSLVIARRPSHECLLCAPSCTMVQIWPGHSIAWTPKQAANGDTVGHRAMRSSCMFASPTWLRPSALACRSKSIECAFVKSRPCPGRVLYSVSRQPRKGCPTT
jgi:hypothetical protein